MKPKLFMFALMGTLVFQQSAMTQTSIGNAAGSAASPWPTNSIASNSPATDEVDASNAAAMANDQSAVASNTPAAAVPATTPADTSAAAATATNEAAPATAAAPIAPAVPAAPAAPATPALDTTAVPAAMPANVGAASADTNGPAVSASIPLIEFQDVPLTVAIENLARQAGINYLLDPKIGYGQPDQSGQIKAEPTLSIRWENVTAEQALLALLNNYDLELIRDPKTGIGRITMKDPTAPPPLITRVIQLKYASTSNMVGSVQAALTDRRSHVLADNRTSQLVVVATDPEQEAVDTLIADLDKPTRQVLIETKLVEVSSTPSTQKGVNWSGTLQDQNVSFGNGISSAASTTQIPGTPTTTTLPSGAVIPGSTPQSTTSTTVSSVSQPSVLPGGFSWNTLTGLTPSLGFLNADGVQAVISFLNESYDAQIVSTPRVVTLDNEPATLSVTRMFPVINVQASVSGVSAGGSTISYSNIGTTLVVTPRITANDYIWLKVVPDVSSFFATITKVIQGTEYQADEFDMRHIETQVMIPDQNTLVMGGLVEDNPTATYTQVPLLGNVPVLGWAFKSESVTMEKDNLVIFITPTIVRDTDYQPTTTDFLASKPAQMRQPMNPGGTWDKAEPDWSNPAPTPGEFDNGNPSAQ